MDETAMFLQAARVGGEAHKRVGDRTMTVDVGDWLRLVEMAGAEWSADGFTPVDGLDADDCAPGLEVEPTAGLHVVVSVDPWGHIVHELRDDGHPMSDATLWSEIPATIGRLGRGGLALNARPCLREMSAWMGWHDVDRDRAAFDAVDGES